VSLRPIRADHAVRIQELPARRGELGGALLEVGCGTRVLPALWGNVDDA
jgi:hypothetical protein